MSGYDVDHLDGVLGTYVEGAFYRDPDRMHYGIEHSLFSIGEKLIEAAEDEGFSLTHEGGAYDYGLTFSEDAADQCTDEATYAEIGYNSFKTTSFEYNDNNGLYYAYEYGSEYVDDAAGVQMTFKNLLFLTTDVSVIDDAGRLSVRTRARARATSSAAASASRSPGSVRATRSPSTITSRTARRSTSA